MKFHILTFGDHPVVDPVTQARTTVAERHQGIIESAVAAEAAGFDGVNLGEHHAGEFVTVSPPITLAAIASRTSTLRLSSGVTLIANNDPLRVAEDYAILDLVSGGRAEMMVGRGNLFPATYRLFGQSLADSRALFEENIELVLRLWTETNVTWCGSSRPPLDNVTLQPLPLQKPHPPLWVGGGGSAETAELAARLGLPLALPSSFGDPNKFVPVVREYKERFARYHGSADNAKIGAPWHVHVERSSQAAKRNWKLRYVAYHEWFYGAVRAHNPSFSPAPLDYDWATTDGPAIAASPEEAVDRLMKVSELLSVDTHLFYLDMGGAPVGETLDQIALMGAEVLPHLR